MGDPTPAAALALSIVALLVSAWTFWAEHLAPFKLATLASRPTFHAYASTSRHTATGPGVRWIPSFDLGLTVWNEGQRTGLITNVRLLTRFIWPDAKEDCSVEAQWIVDYPKFTTARDRFAMFDSAVLDNWYGLALRGGESQRLHLVLECPLMVWDTKRPTFAIECDLQVMSTAKPGWTHVDRFRAFGVFDGVFKGDSFGLSRDGEKFGPVPDWLKARLDKLAAEGDTNVAGEPAAEA